MELSEGLEAMRAFFQEGHTQVVAFRKEQLKKLRASILDHEDELYEALFNDLHKSKEEVWMSEAGIVLSEINDFLKHLDRWAKPQKTTTNFINQPGKSRIMSEPLGVVLIISPWNYPFQLTFLPLVGAIAAGNCVILKPSEFTPSTGAVMTKIIEDAFQPEYIRMVTGDGATVIPAMMNAIRFDHIFYTGSTRTGRLIYEAAAAQLIPVTLELGGKSPCLITSSANLQVAARRIVAMKFLNAGQICIAPDYLLVHPSVKDRFVNVLKDTILKFYGADPLKSYDYARIINKKQFDRLVGYLKNAQILVGGGFDEQSLYIAPTVIDNPSMDDPIMQEEIFGPLLPIIEYKDDEEAKRLVSQNQNPLAFYVFTGDSREARRWLENIPSGGACVNQVVMHYINKKLPFGGRGQSGTGRYHGKFSFETFSHQKAVLISRNWPDLPFAYPSYTGKLKLMKRLMK